MVFPIMLVVGADVLIAGVMAMALITLIVVVPRAPRDGARICLALSSAAVFLPMGLAFSYALGRVFGMPALSVQMMAAIHGSLNAVGFAFLGLVGWHGAALARH